MTWVSFIQRSDLGFLLITRQCDSSSEGMTPARVPSPWDHDDVSVPPSLIPSALDLADRRWIQRLVGPLDVKFGHAKSNFISHCIIHLCVGNGPCVILKFYLYRAPLPPPLVSATRLCVETVYPIPSSPGSPGLQPRQPRPPLTSSFV